MTNNQENQFTISYELLFLMQWILDNEPEQLKKLIISALQKGFKKELLEELEFSKSNTDQLNEDQFKYSVINFLNFLDAMLQDMLNEYQINKIIKPNLLPILYQIDKKNCDSNLIQSILEQVSIDYEANPKKDPQNLLFKELLKQWKPNTMLEKN